MLLCASLSFLVCMCVGVCVCVFFLDGYGSRFISGAEAPVIRIRRFICLFWARSVACTTALGSRAYKLKGWTCKGRTGINENSNTELLIRLLEAGTQAGRVVLGGLFRACALSSRMSWAYSQQKSKSCTHCEPFTRTPSTIAAPSRRSNRFSPTP